MALSDYLSIKDPKAQVNNAFQEKYGLDAPGDLLAYLSNQEGGKPLGAGFYERVLRGDWDPEFREKRPDYLQQSNISQLARQQLNMRKEANQPIVSALQGQKSSLSDRYSAILDELKNSENKETTATTRERSAEFGRRGIPLSSGAYEQAVNLSTQPISQNYAVQRALALVQKQQEEDKLAEQIATLQAGNPAESIGAGNQLYNPVTQNSQATALSEFLKQHGLVSTGVQSLANATSTNADEYKSLADLVKQFRG